MLFFLLHRWSLNLLYGFFPDSFNVIAPSGSLPSLIFFLILLSLLKLPSSFMTLLPIDLWLLNLLLTSSSDFSIELQIPISNWLPNRAPECLNTSQMNYVQNRRLEYLLPPTHHFSNLSLISKWHHYPISNCSSLLSSSHFLHLSITNPADYLVVISKNIPGIIHFSTTLLLIQSTLEQSIIGLTTTEASWWCPFFHSCLFTIQFTGWIEKNLLKI